MTPPPATPHPLPISATPPDGALVTAHDLHGHGVVSQSHCLHQGAGQSVGLDMSLPRCHTESLLT